MNIAGEEDEFGEQMEAEELVFIENEEQLPWLEADEEFDSGASNTGRLIAFGLGSLVVLAAIIGGAYFYLQDKSDAALVADGSTIEAPAEPYKAKPDDPGGAKAAGTGDTSFAVADGRATDSRVAPSPAVVPAPSIDRNQAAAPAAPAKGGVGVQVGAYSSKDRAEQGWQQLVGRFTALKGVGHRVVEGSVDGSPIFRLQALSDGVAGAQQLCSTLRAAGADCQVKN